MWSSKQDQVACHEMTSKVGKVNTTTRLKKIYIYKKEEILILQILKKKEKIFAKNETAWI